MTTTELIAYLLEMRESQFVCEPGSMAHVILKEAAERLAALVSFATPIPELKNHFPVVLYFKAEEERGEFVKAALTAHPDMKLRNL